MSKEYVIKTALVRSNGNLKIVKDLYSTNKEMGKDLRNNGYRVLKIWDGNIDEWEVWEWEFLNRK